MAKKIDTDERAKDDPLADQASGESAAAEAADAATTPEERIAELEARCEELSARALRAQADYKNLRRRSLEDLEAGLRRQLQPLLGELLFVLDYLDLALASPLESPDAKNLAVGVEMTRAKLVQALENSEVYPIATEGAFDPTLHEATESREVEGAAPGTIVETTLKGYTWQGNLLRAARVVVAAGGDAQAEEGAPTEEAE